MSFTDTLKRSLGFEESEDGNNKKGLSDYFSEFIQSATGNPNPGSNNQQNVNPQYYNQKQSPNPNQNPNPNSRPTSTSRPVMDDDYEVIIPVQTYYNIVLIRPKTIDDINYVIDQIVEEKNPVIIDLSFLEKESPANFKLAGDKIKQIRSKFGAQALLLEHNEEKNLILISPKKVKLIKK